MITLAWLLVAAPVVLFVYAYLVYPIVLQLAGGERARAPEVAMRDGDWPPITVVVVAYNAERSLARTLDHLLAADYPRDRLTILVVSDGSTDDTEAIARGYASRGVELLRVPRGGKALAENAAAGAIRTGIVVNTDATVVIAPHALAALVRHFADPAIGVVSGRDVAVANTADPHDQARAEQGYSGYEMWVRSLEARHGLIAGATGSLYAQRREIFAVPISPYASRDFASTLIAYLRGYRSIADDEAVVYVGNAPSLLAEYRRKARTMVLGLDTLRDYRALLDPMRHGWLAFMLLSHKLARWLVYLLAPLALVGLVLLAVAGAWWARVLLGLGLLVAALGVIAIRWPSPRRNAALFSVAGYVTATGAAAVVAWLRAARGIHSTVWEPTVRTR